MTLNNIATLNEYLRYVNEKPSELRALFRDLLASFTPFFDREIPFDALSRTILPALARSSQDRRTPRSAYGYPAAPPARTPTPSPSFYRSSWTPGGKVRPATAHSSPPQVQIFATDINDAALETARAGMYDESRLWPTSPRSASRISFVPPAGGFLINKSIRDMCIFAHQDLANDPPFSRMDLISCRRVLRSLASFVAKARDLPVALRPQPRRTLILGDFQDVNHLSDYFAARRRPQKCLPKAPPFYLLGSLFSQGHRGTRPAAWPSHRRSERAQELHEIKQAENLLTARYVPASIVVNEDLQILRIWGHVGPISSPPPAPPPSISRKLPATSLLRGIRAALPRAKRTNKPVRKQKVPVESKGRVRSVNLEISPLSLPSSSRKFFLIVFQEESAAAAPLR